MSHCWDVSLPFVIGFELLLSWWLDQCEFLISMPEKF